MWIIIDRSSRRNDDMDLRCVERGISIRSRDAKSRTMLHLDIIYG